MMKTTAGSQKVQVGMSILLAALVLEGCGFISASTDASAASEGGIIHNPGAATSLTWTTSSPSYHLTVSPSWTLAAGGTISNQSIQYFADPFCVTPLGSPISLSATATTDTFTGSDLITYSYQITTVSASSSASIVSNCSSPMSLNAMACIGNRLTNSPYADGSGTALDPFLICTPTQMNAIGANSSDWSKHFKLAADIDMSAYTGTQYQMIGNSGTNFTGVLDGNNHTISNLSLTDTTSDGVGLIGYMSGASAAVKNLSLSNVAISGDTNNVNVGAFVGVMSGGTISNCKGLSGTVDQPHSSFLQMTGGLVGQMTNATMTDSTSAINLAPTVLGFASGGVVGRVSSSTLTNVAFTGTIPFGACSSSVGGIAGALIDSTVTTSYSTGSVNSGSGQTLGGIAGSVSGDSDIVQSYSSSPLFGNVFYVGGLAGNISTNNGHGISDSYATGTLQVTPGGVIGGLVGRVTSGAPSFTNNYASGAITLIGATFGGLIGQDNNAGSNRGVYANNFFDHTVNSTLNGVGSGPTPAGITASTTAAMQSPTIFSGAGWTSPPWNLTTTGSYLKLSWQP